MMKSIFYFFIILLLVISPYAYTQKLGAVFIGMNNYIASESENVSNINTKGLAIGWLIPLNVSNMKLYYKVKASHHQIEDYYSYRYDRNLDYFFSAVNEILIGKEVKLNAKLDLIPQLGFGAIGEAAYYDWDKGFTHGEVFIDISFVLKYNLIKFGVGFIINFEKDIIPASTSIISGKRLNIALLIMK